MPTKQQTLQISPVSKQRGKRVSAAISMSDLGTAEFSKKHSISFGTLQSWKTGNRTLSLKGAQKLSLALKQEGWFCHPDWLLHAKGLPPTPLEDINSEAKELSHGILPNLISGMSEDFLITKELTFFSHLYPNKKTLLIDDNSMSPIYKKGDLVAGTPIEKKDYNNAIGYPCIVDVSGLGTVCRTLQRSLASDQYQLSVLDLSSNISSPVIVNPEIISLTPIIWSRRPLSIFTSVSSQ